jgi:hypothetical protein
LGADILYYKPEEIKRILLMSGVLNLKNIALMLILFMVFLLFHFGWLQNLGSKEFIRV